MCSHVCRICQAHVDMIRHPSSAVPRNRVYGKAHLQDIWRNELGPQTTCLFFPDPDPIKLHDDSPVLVLLVATLVTIWWYHTAFEPRTVLASADLAITQGRAQLSETKHQREKH